jgi:hypothetical protein
MFTFLLDLPGDRALGGKGKPGKSERSKAARLCCMKSLSVKKFLGGYIEAGNKREFFRRFYASR